MSEPMNEHQNRQEDFRLYGEQEAIARATQRQREWIERSLRDRQTTQTGREAITDGSDLSSGYSVVSKSDGAACPTENIERQLAQKNLAPGISDRLSPESARKQPGASGRNLKDPLNHAMTPARAQPPTVIAIRLRVAEACNWLRDGAPGKALEVLETLQDSLKGKHEH